MNSENKNKLAGRAVFALAFIAVVGMFGGIVIAYLGQPVGAVVTVVVGAVSGIVAIVLRDNQQ